MIQEYIQLFIEKILQPIEESFSASVALGAIVTAIIFFYFTMVARKKLPIAHNVALIGFPRSGKTTLITALFAEIFSRKIRGISITPRGEETINRVNDDIARLENGEELGPTTDQDLFAYRAEMLTNSFFFSRRYKIEIGDFPGEDSDDLSKKDLKWLHKLPYFKWVLNADSFIFVVDTAHIINKEESHYYRSQITSSFRAAWQKLKDHHYDGIRQLRHKPIALVFAKCDLFDKHIENNVNKHSATSENKIPEWREMLLNDYSDLIAYLKSESTKFTIVFSSSFSKDTSSGIRIGSKELLKGILPR